MRMMTTIGAQYTMDAVGSRFCAQAQGDNGGDRATFSPRQMKRPRAVAYKITATLKTPHIIIHVASSLSQRLRYRPDTKADMYGSIWPVCLLKDILGI